MFGLAVSMAVGFISQFAMFPLMFVSFAVSFLLGPFFSNVLMWLISLLLPFAIVFALSKNKLGKSRLETKYLFGHIMSEFARLYALMACLGMAIVLSLSIATQTSLDVSVRQAAGGLICISMPLLMLLMVVVYYPVLGKTAYFFLRWLSEPALASAHREKWLEFKDFIIINSEIEGR